MPAERSPRAAEAAGAPRAAPTRVAFSETMLHDPRMRGSLDGIGTYTRELRSRLGMRGDLRLVHTVLTWRAARDARGMAMALGAYPALDAALGITLGITPAGARALEREVDVFFATDYRVPRLSHTPVCATVHDAVPLSHPEWANPSMRAVKNWILLRTIERADRILAISKAMVGEIVTHYGVDERRISVVPLGVDERWLAPVPREDVARIRVQHGLARPYVLAVGTLQPRKNTERAIEAYLALPERLRGQYEFVVVGKAGWRADGTVAKLREARSKGVRWLDRVPQHAMRGLYAGASAMFFPSLYEGFGLPVLEAFASRLPVVSSNATSLPEVAGDAALLVDPHDVEGMSDALRRVLEDGTLADSLRAAGFARACAATWQACADATAAALKECAG